MAVIHFQFESIHLFYDGNGRTGRIINILYLVLKDLLNLPVLYLSRYIIQNKDRYYRLLQDVRNNDNWEEWILVMLQAVVQTSRQTVAFIQKIRSLMLETKHRLRVDLEKTYSQDLLNNIFRHPYTKIEFLQQELDVTRQTATKYLDKLVEAGFLKKAKIGRSNYYINEALLEIFLHSPEAEYFKLFKYLRNDYYR
jgi:Fic family protein